MKKIMKYILTASFAFLFCLLFAGGFGMKAEAADPIKISTEAELWNLVERSKEEILSNQTVVLQNDISITYKGHENDFLNIGSEDRPFAGIFDGNGFTISGLNNRKSILPDHDNGLFAWTNGATIKDLTLKDPVVDCAFRGGILVGHAENTTIENIRIHGGKLKVQPGNNIVSLITNVGFSGGAIAGSINGTTLYNCEVRGTEVVNNSTAGVAALGGEGLYMGGLVGSATNSVIEYCRMDDGWQIDDEGKQKMVESTIRNEYDVAVGALGGKAVYAGGIAGEIKSGSKIIDSYSTADVYVYCGTYVSVGAGNVAYAGGVVAEMYGDSCTVTRCHYAGNIHTKQYNALLVIPIIENDKYISGVAQYSESKEKNNGIDSSFFQRSASKTTKKFYALNDETDTDNYRALSDEEYRDRSFWIGEDYDLYGTIERAGTADARGTAAGEHVNRWVMDYKRGIPIHGNSLSAAIDFPGAGEVTIDGTDLIENSIEGRIGDCSVSTSDPYNFAIQGFDTYENEIKITANTNEVKDQANETHENAYKFSGWYLKRDNQTDSVSQIKSDYETLTGAYSDEVKVGDNEEYTTGNNDKFPLEDNDLYIAHYQANVVFHDVNGNVINKKSGEKETGDQINLSDDYYNYQDAMESEEPTTKPAGEGYEFYGWTDIPKSDGGYAGITTDELNTLINGGHIYQSGDLVEKPLKLYPIYTNYLLNISTIMEGNEQDKNESEHIRDNVAETAVEPKDDGLYLNIYGLNGNGKLASGKFVSGYRFLGWYEQFMDDEGNVTGERRISNEPMYKLEGVSLNEKHVYKAKLEYYVSYQTRLEKTATETDDYKDWFEYSGFWQRYESDFQNITAYISHKEVVDHWSKNEECTTEDKYAGKIYDRLTVYGHNRSYKNDYDVVVTGDFPGAGNPGESQTGGGASNFTVEANTNSDQGYNFVGWGKEYYYKRLGSYNGEEWSSNSTWNVGTLIWIDNEATYYFEAHYTANVNFHVHGEAVNSTTRIYGESVFKEQAETHRYTTPSSKTDLGENASTTSAAASATVPEREGYFFLGWVDRSDPEVAANWDYIFGENGDNYTAVSANRAVPYLLDTTNAKVERPMEVYAVYVNNTNIKTTTNIAQAGVPANAGINIPEDPTYTVKQKENGSITLTLTAEDNKTPVKGDDQNTKYRLQYVECITNPGTDDAAVTRLTPDTQGGNTFTLNNFDLGPSYLFIAYYEPLTVVYHLDDEAVHVDIRNSGQQLGESPEPKYTPADIETAGDNYAFVGWTINEPNSGDDHYYYLMDSHDDQNVTLVQPTDVVNQSMELYPAYARAGIKVTTNIEDRYSESAENVRGLRWNAEAGEYEIYAAETVSGSNGESFIFTGWKRTSTGNETSDYSSESVAGVSDVFDGATYTAMYEEGYTVTYHYWNPDKEDGAGYDVLYSAGVKNGDKLVETIENTEPDGTIEEITVPVHTEAFTGIMNTLAAGQTFEEWQTADGKGWDEISSQTITDDMDLYPVIWQTKVYDSSDTEAGKELSQTATGGKNPEVYVQADLTKSDQQKVSVYFAGVYSNDSLRVNVGKQSYGSDGKFTGVPDIPVDVYNEYRLVEVENPDYGESNPSQPPTITEMQGDLLANANTDKDGNAIFEFDGKLTITKKLESDVATDEFFIFKVTKLDASGNEESTTDVIVKAGKTVTMSLPYGTYKVTEDDGWAWRYTPSYETETKNPDGDVSQQNAGVDAGDWGADSGTIYINSFESSVICTNKESNSKWFDSSSNVRNVFGKAQAGQEDQNNN